MKKGARVGMIKLILFQGAISVQTPQQYTQCLASAEGRKWNRQIHLPPHSVRPQTACSNLTKQGFSNLKPGVADNRADYNEKSKGKKRKKYNVTKKNRLQDQADVSSTIFVDSPVTVDGEESLTLVSGGRIYSRLSWLFMYTKHSVAPDDWVKALQDSGIAIWGKSWGCQIFHTLMHI